MPTRSLSQMVLPTLGSYIVAHAPKVRFYVYLTSCSNFYSLGSLRNHNYSVLRVIRPCFGRLTWLTSSCNVISERKLLLPLNAHSYVILLNEGSLPLSRECNQTSLLSVIGHWFVGGIPCLNCWAFSFKDCVPYQSWTMKHWPPLSKFQQTVLKGHEWKVSFQCNYLLTCYQWICKFIFMLCAVFFHFI